MMRSLFSGVSGLKSHQTAMDVIGNNVANVNSPAYKASTVIFQNIVSQTLSAASGSTTTTGGRNSKQVGLGVSISTIAKNITEGSTQSTDSTLDFSIGGEGYFVVQCSDGSHYYTRNGNFTTDNDGYLVTANGDYVMAVKSTDATGTNIANDKTFVDTDLTKIQIIGKVDSTHYNNSYAIDTNGVITCNQTVSGSPPSNIIVGRVVLSTFNNPGGLDSIGGGLYTTSANSGAATTNFVNKDCGEIQSGQLEMSNVSLATELTNMIIVQRGFQANSRVITTSDTMLEELVNLKR